jgi:hypothetical protein
MNATFKVLIEIYYIRITHTHTHIYIYIYKSSTKFIKKDKESKEKRG